MRRLITAASLALIAAMVTLPAVQAAPRAAAPAKLTKLSIMVGGLSKQIYLPNELTARLGYFTKEGLDVTLIDEPSGQSSEDATLAGQVQAGSGAYQHTIELQALGKGMETVVQLGIAPGEAEMVSAKEAGSIHSFKDLRGKNLGVTELGSGTHAISKYLLLKAGVPIDQAHFIPVGAGDTFIAAMQQGHIDAGMTTEPTISRLLSSGVGKVLVDLRTPKTTRKALGSDFPFISVFMTTSYVNSHKSVVQRVVNAYARADSAEQRFTARMGESLRQALRRARVQGLLGPLNGFSGLTAVGIFLWFGGREVLAGRRIAGDWIAFLF